MPKRKVKSSGVTSNNQTRHQKLVFEDEPEPQTPATVTEEVPDDGDELPAAWAYYLDVIEDSVSLPNSIQLVMIFFLGNMIWSLYMQKKADDPDPDHDPMWLIVVALMSCGAVLIQLGVVLNNKWNDYVAQFEAAKQAGEDYEQIDPPALPPFHYIYSVFLPLAVALVQFPEKVSTVAPLVLQVPYMHPLVMVTVSYVAMFQMGSGGYMGFDRLAAPLVFGAAQWLLQNFVAESLSITERSLFAHLITALLLSVSTSLSDITLVILQQLTIAFAAALALCYCLLDLYRSRKEGTLARKLVLGVMYLVFVGNGVLISVQMLTPTLGKNPFVWLRDYILAPDHLDIFKVWAAGSAAVVPTLLAAGRHLPALLRRKIWHFAILGALAQPMISQPQLSSLALVGLFGVFCFTELVRAEEIPPLGRCIRQILLPFQDSKDTRGKFVLSYIFLVLGVALPLWLNNVDKSQSASSIIGLILLGLGDAVASLAGQLMGSHPWPDSSKTVEGSVGFLLATLWGMSTYRYYTEDDSYDSYIVGITAIVTAAIEGTIAINDNVIVPVIGWLTIKLVQGVRY